DRIVDTLRRQKRYQFVPLDEVQDNDDSLENVTEDRLTSETIKDLMNDLTPEQRQVIHMRFHLEMPIEAVARELDRTPGSIKALQYRGIRAISEQMMQEPPARRAVVA
nr:hypothetical protein [Chloroflexaceae bacterium]